MRRRGARPHRAARRFLRLRSAPEYGRLRRWLLRLWSDPPDQRAADPPARHQAVRSGREDARGAGCRVPAGSGCAGGRPSARPGGTGRLAPAAAPGAAPGPGPRGRARRDKRGHAAVVPSPVPSAVASAHAGRRPGHPAHLAPVRPGRYGPGHRRRAGRLRPDRIRVRAASARARDRRLYGHRPPGPVLRWITMVLVAVGITVSEDSPGHNEPTYAIYPAPIFQPALNTDLLSD